MTWNGARKQTALWKFLCTSGHIWLFTSPIACARLGSSHHFFQTSFFSLTKIALLYSVFVFTLKKKKLFKCKCIKISRWKRWHLDSRGMVFGTSSYKQVKNNGTKEHLLDISSGCPVGPRRRRCLLRLVPFWTPPARHGHLHAVTKMGYLCDISCKDKNRQWKFSGRLIWKNSAIQFMNMMQHASTKQPLSYIHNINIQRV